ncbi:MAG: glutaminyl-peptide cyclotransferase [Actinomycetota bacterium]
MRHRLSCLLVVSALLAGACGDDGDSSAATTTVAEAVTTTAGAVAETDDGVAVDDSTTARWPTPPADLDPADPARWTVTVVERRPHDPGAFTQGLEQLSDGRLLESTGIRGESTIRIVDPTTGDVLESQPLDDTEFGEGATVVDDTIVQLTWRAERARRWSLPDLEPLSSWDYTGEGWGICRLGDRLAMSDGTSTLSFRDPDDFSLLEQVTVTFDGNEVTRLNELECVDGHVVANIWQSPTIVVIRPDGAGVASIDGTPLVDEIGTDEPGRAVLNGIAVRDEDTFWMTGKLWPTLFAVTVTS